MTRAFLLATSAVVIILTLAVGASDSRAPENCSGERCEAVIRGLRAFFDRRLSGLGGNGRSCADCHMAVDSFQLSPANAELRFQLLQWRRRWDPNADDPLFRPVDADDFRANGDSAADFSNLRVNGLVRISFPLPPRMRLIDPATNAPSSETFVDVWRMVPTINNVAMTGPDDINPWPRGPNQFGGYQLDARVGTLQEQALGALLSHAQIQTAPSQDLLDDVTAFQRTVFSSRRVRAFADAIREGTVPIPNPDPPLEPLEERGKLVFERACTQCHGGAGQSTPQPAVPHFVDIQTQCPRPVDTVSPARFSFTACPPALARNARTYEITLPNGTSTRRTSSDPGRALLTGFVGGPAPSDDWNKFDTPSLRGINGTAPYFHNNSAPTLEAVVDHYIEFFKRLKAIAAPGTAQPAASTDGVSFDRQPLPEERAALLAYLRKL